MKRIMALAAGLAWAALSTTAAPAQTDIAGSFYKTFTQSTTGQGVKQTPANSEGGMFELRHIQSSWIGYEFTYSLNPEDQHLAPVPGACAFYCHDLPETVTSKDHQFSLDWVLSKQFGRLMPFAVGGVGFAVVAPAGAYGNDLNTSVKPSYVYGGGVDWGFTSRAGLRLQFRDNLHKAPNVDPAYPATGVFTHTSEPMVGVYFRL